MTDTQKIWDEAFLAQIAEVEAKSSSNPNDWRKGGRATKANPDKEDKAWWDENGKMRERLGELILRLGMRAFLKAVNLPPVPQMVRAPRANPYYFWDPEEVK